MPISSSLVHWKKFIYIVAGLCKEKAAKKNWRHYFKPNFHTVLWLVLLLYTLTPYPYFRLFVFVSLSIILKQQQIFILIEMVQNPRSRLVRTLYVLFQYYNILPSLLYHAFFLPTNKICKLVTCHRTSLILSCACQRMGKGLGSLLRFRFLFSHIFSGLFLLSYAVSKNWWA